MQAGVFEFTQKRKLKYSSDESHLSSAGRATVL
ncbi:MAG: hypothetical protein UV70_C0007G0012 [Parcubacteria group bacterium GW2011_GWA2_43_13]|nr:MAG: hypothetical protein UV70_C0007G0012 [Parcubacteria group bacterium GW2011_GWA2_43_13]